MDNEASKILTSVVGGGKQRVKFLLKKVGDLELRRQVRDVHRI